MIRINLLPKEISRDKSKIELVILGVLIIIGICVGMYYYYHINVKAVEAKETERMEKEKELASLQQIKFELEKQRGVEKRLKRKYAQIDKLNKKRVGPVTLLNVVSTSLQGFEQFKLPDGQMRPISAWLNNMENLGSILSISGIALDYTEVANYMSSLESHEEINNVRLVTSQKKIDEENELIQFKLECNTKF